MTCIDASYSSTRTQIAPMDLCIYRGVCLRCKIPQDRSVQRQQRLILRPGIRHQLLLQRRDVQVHLFQRHGTEQGFCTAGEFDRPKLATAVGPFYFYDAEDPLFVLAAVCGVDADRVEFLKL